MNTCIRLARSSFHGKSARNTSVTDELIEDLEIFLILFALVDERILLSVLKYRLPDIVTSVLSRVSGHFT